MKPDATARQLPFSWDDYRSWDDGQRWELIDGDAYAMSPAPNTRHQWVVVQLAIQLGVLLKGKRCKPFVSPVDVRLSDVDVVQPDMVVVCDPDQIRRTHIEGTPALVIEVLSPSTELYDRRLKMRLYAASGVKEVWLVTPYPWLVEVYVLDGASYRLTLSLSKEDTLRSPTLPDLVFELAAVFDFPLEPGEEPPVAREPPPRRYAASVSDG
jgi:Uma2 family endonuclease